MGAENPRAVGSGDSLSHPPPPCFLKSVLQNTSQQDALGDSVLWSKTFGKLCVSYHGHL